MTEQSAISPEGAAAPQRAFGSSFYAAMRILPRAQREAMFEIYSFCRAPLWIKVRVVDAKAPSARAADPCTLL